MKNLKTHKGQNWSIPTARHIRHAPGNVFFFRGENPFKDLYDFVQILLILPHSNAVERVFNQMNLVKSQLRNRMFLNTSNNITSVWTKKKSSVF
jgi:hypothetical protein